MGKRPLASIALVSGAAIAMLWISWMKWPDVLTDFGREIYVPWMIANGKVLYRDVLYFSPPLSPYVNALWFKCFGPGMSVIAWANLCLLAILLVTMHRVMRQTATRFAVTIAGLMFVFLFAFGQHTRYGNYNYVMPYSHEATHGMLLSWIVLACQIAHLRSSRLFWLACSGLSLGLVFLTKPEFFIGAAAASGTALSLWAWCHPGRKPVLYRTMLFTTFLFVPPLAAWVLLATRITWSEAGIGVLGSWWYLFDDRITGLPLYRYIMGTSDPLFNIEKMAYTLGLYLAVFAPAAALAMNHARRRTAVAIAVVLFSILLASTFLRPHGLPWEELGRPLPLITLVAGSAILLGIARRRDREDKEMASLILVVFSLFLQLKMILNARIWHYGFILGMPATMVVVLALMDWVPAAIRRRGGQPFAFQAISLAALAAAAVFFAAHSGRIYASKSVPVGEGRDAFFAEERGLDVKNVTSWLNKNTHPSDTLAVFPDGVFLNYLSRRFNSTPIVNLMPPEMIMFGSDRLLRLLQNAPPSYIALVHADTSGIGPRFFGKDYGHSIAEWIVRNYHPVYQAGNTPFVDDRFGILIAERNGKDR